MVTVKLQELGFTSTLFFRQKVSSNQDVIGVVDVFAGFEKGTTF